MVRLVAVPCVLVAAALAVVHPTVAKNPVGLHGSRLVSVSWGPEDTALARDRRNVIVIAVHRGGVVVRVRVRNTGDSTERRVAVRLVLKQPGLPQSLAKTIPLISPEQTRVIGFVLRNVAFAVRLKLKATVEPVPGERNLGNNTAVFPVLFTLP